MSLLINGFLFCMMMGCDKSNQPVINNNMDTTTNTDTTINQQQYSWLALGDSYTIGQSVNEDERFPVQTIALLKNDGLNFNSPKYIATTGWTTLDLLDGIAEQNLQGTFNIVTLLIGVNDQYQTRDTTGYRANFTECLQKAIAFAGKREHVFVVSIPDYSVTPFAAGSDTAAIRLQIDEFNAINKEVTSSYNISYTDITPLTREAKTDSTLIATDGLHPSGKEYGKWAELLAPEIEKVLK